jgi:hypothetical protein
MRESGRPAQDGAPSLDSRFRGNDGKQQKSLNKQGGGHFHLVTGALLFWTLGLGVYIAVAYRDVSAGVSELGHAALNLAQHGFIGNPYNQPTGPTAHVSPLPTLLLAAVYRIAGGNSAFARVILSLVGVACYLACCLMSLKVCAVLRLRPAALVAVALPTMLVPFELFDALVPLRQWDQPFAALLLMCGLLLTFRAVTARTAGLRAVTGLAALTGISALCSPMAMPAFAVAAAVVIWQSTSVARRLRLAALYAVIAFGLMLPWAIRNERVLGWFIMTRSNFPLEFVLGNLGSPRSNDVTPARLTYHPNKSPDVVRHINEVGEFAYMAELRETALQWLGTHPLDFLRLSANRVWLAFFPDRDTIEWRPVLGQSGTYWAFTLFGLLKVFAVVAATLLSRHRLNWLGVCVLPLAPYFVTHIETRYLYPVFFPSACLIAAAFDHVRTARSARSPKAGCTHETGSDNETLRRKFARNARLAG